MTFAFDSKAVPLPHTVYQTAFKVFRLQYYFKKQKHKESITYSVYSHTTRYCFVFVYLSLIK